MQNVQGDNQGNAFFEMNPMKGCSSTSIKLRTLDDYWNYVLKQEHVFLMKIDVQGFEGFVFQGGVEMFKSKPPPFIFMEFSPERYRNYGIDGAQILKDLIGYGYHVKKISDGAEVTLTNGMVEKLTEGNKEVDLELKHHKVLGQYSKGDIEF